MNIEALVAKYYDTWVAGKGASWVDHMHNALTEQAETHAIELRAYEATVANLNERIRQMEAERVPLGILDSMINLVEGYPVIDWRNSKTGMRIKDSSAWVEFYCAAKNAIAAAPAQEKA